MRRRMCFRCGSHLPSDCFNGSQDKSYSPWCRICETWPAGTIPLRGINYQEYCRKMSIAEKPIVHSNQVKNMGGFDYLSKWEQEK